MKTKEEILQNTAEKHSYDDWGNAMYDTHEHTQIEYAAEAMDEYAAQVAKGFAEWLFENYKETNLGNKFTRKDEMDLRLSSFYTHELFPLYIEKTLNEKQ